VGPQAGSGTDPNGVVGDAPVSSALVRRTGPILIVVIGLLALIVDFWPNLTLPALTQTEAPRKIETKLGLDLQGGLKVEYRVDPNGDRIPFIFKDAEGTGIHTTFAYDRAKDTWSWTIDNLDKSGKSSSFAKLTLTRRK